MNTERIIMNVISKKITKKFKFFVNEDQGFLGDFENLNKEIFDFDEPYVEDQGIGSYDYSGSKGYDKKEIVITDFPEFEIEITLDKNIGNDKKEIANDFISNLKKDRYTFEYGKNFKSNFKLKPEQITLSNNILKFILIWEEV